MENLCDKRGYYIHFEARKSVGVSKKIEMQVKELKKYFKIKEIDIKSLDRTMGERVLGLLPWLSISRTYKKGLDELYMPDFVYVRRAIADNEYMNFLKEIRNRYPNCKIIVEIFTYPYDKDEFFKWNAWPFYLKELANRNKMKKYVDKFVTYSKNDMIFGVHTIQTINGICVSDVKPVCGKMENNHDIVMIAVAYMQRHHGYERIIKGMNEYYKNGGKRSLKLHLVGDGPEKNNYIKLVKKFNLENNIVFFPTTVNEALDKLYDEADLAMGAFGCYKDKVYYVSTIKAKEYMAKGLPVINGCKEQLDTQYCLTVTNDPSVLDMNEIIEFYDNIYYNKSRKKVRNEIRNQAMKKLDMSVAMKPIIQYIEDGD